MNFQKLRSIISKNINTFKNENMVISKKAGIEVRLGSMASVLPSDVLQMLRLAGLEGNTCFACV